MLKKLFCRPGLLAAVAFFLVAAVCSYAGAEERNRLDRPKDSQDVCGYTLADGQVIRLSENNSLIQLDIVGSPVLQKIYDGPICAFKVDNPDLTDVSLIFVVQEEARPYAAPPRIEARTTGVLLWYRSSR